MHSLPGRCHCGNVTLVYETAVAPAETEVRSCACGFCRRHGALTVSDPEGRLRLAVADPQRLIRYRFALGTADFLICADCGVYAAAVLTGEDAAWAVLNLNLLDARADFTRAPRVSVYDREDEAARVRRRKASWTPIAA